MGKILLPPGFRFHPTDVELVKYYLKRKVMGKSLHFEAIAEVDIYKFAPWDLPNKSCLQTGDLKWYFFCPREKKYASGTRMNRATGLGYWKTTGKDRSVHYNNEVVGMIKTLVFHRGKAPKGERTDWVMYEYRLDEKELDLRGVAQDAYVLCSVFKKDGPGPRNGAQYGAPFKEEDWDVDDAEEVNNAEVVSSVGMSALMPICQNNSIVRSAYVPDGTCFGSPYEVPSTCFGSPYEVPSDSNTAAVVADSYVELAEPPQLGNENDDILAMLANFSEESPFIPNETKLNEVDNIKHGGNNVANPCSDGIDVYNDLADLSNLVGFGEPEYNVSGNPWCSTMDQMQGSDKVHFLELRDLDAPLNCSIEDFGYEQVNTGGFYAPNPCNSAELVHGTAKLHQIHEDEKSHF